jgi:hypothetical protein
LMILPSPSVYYIFFYVRSLSKWNLRSQYYHT